MTPQELKNSILQLAIQGKLVEQRADEGTGAELLDEILAAKNAEGAKGRGNKLTRSRGVRGGCEEAGISNLPKAAKFQPSNTLSALSASPREEIPDDEKPFDIPESWEWVRLGEIVEIYTGKRDANFGSSEGEYDFFTCSNQPIKCSSYSYDGEFLIMPGNGANIGMVIHYKGKFEAYQRTYLLENRFGFFMDYLECHLKANWKQYNADKMYGSAIPYIKLGNLTNYLVAIPPLAEQKRIVAKIEELMPLVERYEKAWSRLEDFNKRFPVDMQKSLLQMVIQGKLVEQRADEGTGAELLEKILAAKNAEGAKGRGNKLTRSRGVRGGREESGISNLPKAAKSQPSNTLSALSASPREEIPDDEKPFDIPESWEWVRLGDIVIKDIKRGKSPTYTQKSGTLVFAQKCNTKAGVINLSLALFLDEAKLSKYPESEFMRDGDIVINSTGNGTLGRVGIYHDSDNPNKLPVVPDSHVTVVRVGEKTSVEYVFYALKHYQPLLEKLCSGSTNQTELSASTVKSLLFPLPPLAEQKRIVAKLEELLPLCERLK